MRNKKMIVLENAQEIETFLNSLEIAFQYNNHIIVDGDYGYTMIGISVEYNHHKGITEHKAEINGIVKMFESMAEMIVFIQAYTFQ